MEEQVFETIECAYKNCNKTFNRLLHKRGRNKIHCCSQCAKMASYFSKKEKAAADA